MLIRLILVVLFFASCSSGYYQKKFVEEDKKLHPNRYLEELVSTIELLESIKVKCNEHISTNKLLAKRNCFPLLDKIKLKANLEKIDSDSFSRIRIDLRAGYNNIIRCFVNDEISKKLIKNPNLLEIGKNYTLSGDFDNYTTGYLTFFSFENCIIEGI